MAEAALAGLVVVDIATMMAAPWAATYLADFGATVIKVEQPGVGDHSRRYGAQKDGVPLFWKSIGRNKKSITLDLRKPEGQDVFRQIVAKADVLIENFRPGTLERWGIGWTELEKVNHRLVMLRVTGFGQEGPYAARGGFGTVAEAMSGFAALTGHPGGPPTLPQFPLADGVCSIFSALCVMMAIYERDVLRTGKGQYIDICLYEPLMRLMESHLLAYDQLGIIPERLGNRSAETAPRGAYLTRDGKWVALSASAQPIAENVFRAIGRPELISDPRFVDNRSRLAHVEELDAILAEWIGQNDLEVVIETFSEAGAVVGPIYNVSQIFADAHYRARGTILEVPDADLGTVRMPNVVAKFSRTPGVVLHTGPRLGEHNREIYQGWLGFSQERLLELQEKGVI